MTRKQCKACPWKVSTDPSADIPNGYCPNKHRNLKSTVAEPGAIVVSDTIRMMACHETPEGKEQPCVGWLANQLGPGNNIALRLATLQRPELGDFELDGEQHERFEDTIC